MGYLVELQVKIFIALVRLQPIQSKYRKVFKLCSNRFLTGLKPDVRPGIIAYDDHTIIFVCGNNVVIQTM